MGFAASLVLRISKARHARDLHLAVTMSVMTAIAHPPAAFELRRGRQQAASGTAAQAYSLRATEDGWSLLAPGGEVVFRGLGLASRRECLEFARSLGVLTVTS